MDLLVYVVVLQSIFVYLDVLIVMYLILAQKLINGHNGIRNRLFRNLLEQEMAYMGQESSGVLSTRFSNDTESVRMLLSDKLPKFMEYAALVVFGVYNLFVIDYTLTLYLIMLAPVAFGTSYVQSEKLETLTDFANTQTAMVLYHLKLMIDGRKGPRYI